MWRKLLLARGCSFTPATLPLLCASAHPALLLHIVLQLPEGQLLLLLLLLQVTALLAVWKLL